jgi:branched-chain amino acid aminotransferase
MKKAQSRPLREVAVMEIRILPLPEEKKKIKFTDESALGFGRIFTDRMLLVEWEVSKGWFDAKIQPYAPFVLDPSALVFHYAQEIFEGLKAYKWADGSIALFRPEINAHRFNLSADRLCMPEVPVDLFLEGITQLVRLEKFNPVNILVEDHYVRAVAGGIGEAKTGGNYAASLKAAQIAKKKGFDQVLWLDGCHRKFIEEVGSMNMFFVYDDVVVTAPLTGSILKGVTRDSVIKLADTMGFRIEERQIAIDELAADIRSGKVREAFGSGTAAVITPVGVLGYKDESFTIGNGDVGNLTRKLYDTLTGIQYGKIPDTFGWIRKIA